jgi:hypothetical protein
MPKTQGLSPIRVAFRTEGRWWVAYVAGRDSMQGAIEIGRILQTAAEHHDAVKDGFIALMAKVMKLHLEDMGIAVLDMRTQAAPESERSGQA